MFLVLVLFPNFILVVGPPRDRIGEQPRNIVGIILRTWLLFCMARVHCVLRVREIGRGLPEQYHLFARELQSSAHHYCAEFRHLPAQSNLVHSRAGGDLRHGRPKKVFEWQVVVTLLAVVALKVVKR
jgi:hypothetical protein